MGACFVEEETFDVGDTTGIGRITMTFDDECRPLGKRMQAGAFSPLGQLSTFDGMDMFGERQLYFEDTTNSDPFDVFSSSLIFSRPADPPQAGVPELGSLASVFAPGALRRRQHRAV